MKLVITVEQFDPNKGYLEYYLAKELTKLGHKVYVFTFGWDIGISRIMSEEGFEVVNIPHFAVINGYHVPSLSGIIYVLKFIKTEKPDIIHCQPLFSSVSLFIMICKNLFDYKIVGSLITGEYSIDNTIKKLGIALIKIFTEKFTKKVQLFFAINEGFRSILTQLFNIPAQKIRIIPLGADQELFRFDTAARDYIRAQLNLSIKDIVIVYSGKIIPSKDLDVLIKASAPLIKENYDVKLLIIGSGETSYLKYLKDLATNLEISNNVIFYPWVHRTKLPRLYSASDIAVWPGAPSISIVEAASVGLPIITKKSQIEMYAIENKNGFAFKKGDTNELREYLKMLICNEELRKKMGCKSRELVEQKLNWKTIAYQYLEAYKSVMNS